MCCFVDAEIMAVSVSGVSAYFLVSREGVVGLAMQLISCVLEVVPVGTLSGTKFEYLP